MGDVGGSWMQDDGISQCGEKGRRLETEDCGHSGRVVIGRLKAADRITAVHRFADDAAFNLADAARHVRTEPGHGRSRGEPAHHQHERNRRDLSSHRMSTMQCVRHAKAVKNSRCCRRSGLRVESEGPVRALSDFTGPPTLLVAGASLFRAAWQDRVRFGPGDA